MDVVVTVPKDRWEYSPRVGHRIQRRDGQAPRGSPEVPETLTAGGQEAHDSE